jgi:DNA-binding CsgD family transcriptional regulator
LRKLETARRQTKAFGLTRRELQVVKEVVAEQGNRRADQHRLGASNRVELALFAAHHRLLSGV